MTIFAIGDIQGCFVELKDLLHKINFSLDRDQLWFTGDLVNRGPDSLATLRYVKSLGENAITVLGNHDLHMLAVLLGFESQRPKDTFGEIIHAQDKHELIDWIRTRPLMHWDQANNSILVHAGIYPGWEIPKAMKHAKEVETILQNESFPLFLQNMYGNKPNQWKESLAGWERLRFITNVFSRMRYCHEDFSLDLKHNGKPGTQPKHLRPWFELLSKQQKDYRIIFGHWSTLGVNYFDNVYALDSGCLWGGKLTALALEKEPRFIHLKCKGELQPPNYT